MFRIAHYIYIGELYPIKLLVVAPDFAKLIANCIEHSLSGAFKLEISKFGAKFILCLLFVICNSVFDVSVEGVVLVIYA